MGFRKVLYYPTMDIKNEDWLKTAVLFWDEINTIVPSSIANPYGEKATQYLSDEGILKPMSVNPGCGLIEDLAADIINCLNTNEGFQLLTQAEDQGATMHRNKLPTEVGRLFDIHPEQLPYEIQHQLHHCLTSESYFRADSSFTHFYMTLLANKIGEQKSIALLTDNALTSNLTDKLRLDNQMMMERGYDFETRNDERYIHLAQGLLTNLIIEGVRIKGTSSLQDVVRFKKKHKDELGLFKTNITKLAQSVSKDKPFDAIRQEIADFYKDEFLPSYNNFKKALIGFGIKWVADNYIKVSVISTRATALPIALTGIALPQALITGDGLSLITSLISYNQDKEENLRTNPYSYLLAATRQAESPGHTALVGHLDQQEKQDKNFIGEARLQRQVT